MLKQDYEVEILINGKPAKEYSHKGSVYIEGRKDTRFSIRIRNNSYSRRLFVPTIDGLSVMNGEEGRFDSGGYIVEPHKSITIDGWRTSDNEVASFYFSSPEGSYRKKMKKGDNLGIIGVAVFREKPKSYVTATFPSYPATQWWERNTSSGEYQSWGTQTNFHAGNSMDSVTAMCCSSTETSGNSGKVSIRSVKQPQQQIGTGFGERKESSVISVSFERDGGPDAVFEIRYNTREQLEKAGISMKKEPLYVAPMAFPGQYCKPPRD